MRAILHIGTEKTGTTSFQAFCDQHRQSLLHRGVLYPKGLGGTNHRFISMYGQTPAAADEAMRSMGLDDKATYENFCTKVGDNLQKQLDASRDAHTCIISSEHLHSRIKSVEQIDKIYRFLSRQFDQIEIFVHLRPQFDLVTSLASTQARVGGEVRSSFLLEPNPALLYYNYNRLIGLWENVFGGDSIHCIAFRANPNFSAAIFRYIGMEWEDLPKLGRVNEALDIKTIVMSNILARSRSGVKIDHRVLDRLPFHEPIRPSLSLAKEVQSRFTESNLTLIKRRHDLSEGQLQPDWSRYPPVGNTHLLDEDLVFPIDISALLDAYNCEISRNK